MASFFRRTKLYKQIQEVCETQAALKRTQHRIALKTKRQLVRMEVASEIQRGRIEALAIQLAAAHSEASVNAARTVAEAEKKRRKMLEGLAAAKGAVLPGQSKDETPEEYKERMARRVQASIPADARGVAAGRMLDAVLADDLKNVSLGKSGQDSDMGVDLAVGLAKQVGVSDADLDQMLKRIAKPNDPDDAGANQYLREQILSKLRADRGEQYLDGDTTGAAPSTTSSSPPLSK